MTSRPVRARSTSLANHLREHAFIVCGALIDLGVEHPPSRPRTNIPYLRRQRLFTSVFTLLICITLGWPVAGKAQAGARDSAVQAVRRAEELMQRREPQSLREAEGLFRTAVRQFEVARRQQDRAKALRRLGVALLEQQRPVDAIATFHDALQGFKNVGDRVGEGATLSNLGTAHGMLRSDSAQTYFDRAIEVWRATGDSARLQDEMWRVSALYQVQQRWDSAMVHMQTALTLAEARHDRAALVQMKNELALILDGAGQVDSSLAVSGAALRLARTISDTAGVAEALRLTGIGYVRKAMFGNALQNLQESLALFRVRGDSNGVLVTLMPISAVHAYLGRADSAQIYNARIIALARSLGRENEEARALNNLGRNEIELGRRSANQAWFDTALVHLRAAYAIRGRAPASDAARLTLSNIGFAYLGLGKLDSAGVYFERTLDLARGTGRPLPIADAVRDMGNLHLLANRPTEAIAAYREALMNQRKAGDLYGEGGTFTGIAEALSSKGARADLAAAVTYYDSAVVVLDSVRRAAGSDLNQVDLSDSNGELARRWVLLWLTRGDRRNISQRDAAYASLAAAERLRSQGLLNLMGAAPRDLRPGPVSDGRELVRAATRDGRAVVSYLLLQDTLLVWAASDRGSLSLTRVVVSADSLARLVTAARREMAPSEDLERCTTAGPADPAEASRHLQALASILLPDPVRRHLHHAGGLVVVPDGILNLLPFAALPVRGEASLGETHALQVVPSLSVLQYLERGSHASPSTEPWRNALIVGNPEMPMLNACGDSAQLMSLPRSGEFSRELAGQHQGSIFLTGAAATEDSVRRALPSATFVQLATHGYAYSSSTRARDSWVALAPGATGDGFLTVTEIIEGPPLAAELIVLAACNTALGDVRDTEGTVGLQRALLGKGARSVLVSLWPMREEPAVQLLRTFYREWISGRGHPTKAEALRRAQREVRSQYPDARDWAGFQLVGSN
jgi:CHAT domain-containing protein/tetratricopeptide (TPR) repeat protein